MWNHKHCHKITFKQNIKRIKNLTSDDIICSLMKFFTYWKLGVNDILGVSI